MENLQVSQAGEVLQHDVLGLCTLLSEPCADAGSFMVVSHSDNHIKQLTRGHFQFHSSSSVRTASNGKTDDGGTQNAPSQPAYNTAEGLRPSGQQPPSLSDAPGVKIA
eukprot:4296269-Pleurochrysis_carterae.AAC.1